MKIIISLLLAIFLLVLAGNTVFAQKTITIILIRHAEKDTSDPKNPDPELSPEGRLRAQNLLKAVKKYDPEMIYSTDFIRTKATVRPLAEKDSLQIHLYDPKKLDEFVNTLLALKAKSIIVVGHNTTTPALANLLIKEKKYDALPETVYNKMWIIKIKGDKIQEQVVEY